MLLITSCEQRDGGTIGVRAGISNSVTEGVVVIVVFCCRHCSWCRGRSLSCSCSRSNSCSNYCGWSSCCN